MKKTLNIKFRVFDKAEHCVSDADDENTHAIIIIRCKHDSIVNQIDVISLKSDVMDLDKENLEVNVIYSYDIENESTSNCRVCYFLGLLAERLEYNPDKKRLTEICEKLCEQSGIHFSYSKWV